MTGSAGEPSGARDGKGPRRVAALNAGKCNRCGVCVAVCPLGAISMNWGAKIDAAKCSGCGDCVPACPREALFLRHVEP